VTNLLEAFEEFEFVAKRFKQTIPLAHKDYFILFKRGIRRFFVDTGRAKEYDPSLITEENLTEIPYDLGQDDITYILLAAQIAFYTQMISDIVQPNRITQHKTDALTVTFSDKVSAELTAEINDLENRLAEVYFKMPQYTLGVRE